MFKTEEVIKHLLEGCYFFLIFSSYNELSSVVGTVCQASLLSSYFKLTFSLLAEMAQNLILATAMFVDNKDHGFISLAPIRSVWFTVDI
jgi:hypothetical protein